MFRNIALGALITMFLVTTSVTGQDSRPSSKPTSKPTSAPARAAKKWHDKLAKPIRFDVHGRWAEYGSPIKLKIQTSLMAVTSNPEQFKNKEIQLRGTIDSICEKKGCWLRMSDGGKEVFVKFKDYAFFAPRHLTGHEVLLEGKVTVDVVKEAERRHMAEDAGKSKEEIEKIKGDQKELRMMADAMRIIEPSQPRQAQMVLLGKHDNTRELTKLESILASPKAYVGRDVDVAGKIVEVGAREFVIESHGQKLKVSFTDPLPDLKLVIQLKNSRRDRFFRGFGTIQEKDNKIHLQVKTAAIIH